MRFSNITFVLAAVSSVLTGVVANPVINGRAESVNERAVAAVGEDLTKDNHYGAPIPPWETGCKPGWYYGNQPDLVKVIGLTLVWLKDSVRLCVLYLGLPSTSNSFRS